ncbi:MAG: diguanylate cyclase, partial [Selenomonadaceae bacterium]|nr:diguanylate cyclase [Selenomonadaceae bacterium]
MEQEIPEGSVLNQLRLYFNTLQQTGNSYLFVTDMKTGTVLLSDNFVEDFDLPGIVLEDMDKYWLPIIYEGDRNRYTASLKAVFETHVTDEHNLEYRVQYRNGEFGWVNCRGKLARDEDGTPVFWAGVIIKMDQRLRADSITGLLNRYAMNKTLKDELEASAGCHGAVVIIGLDNFHVIKETYGHHFGDVVLKQIAQNIMNVLPPD